MGRESLTIGEREEAKPRQGGGTLNKVLFGILVIFFAGYLVLAELHYLASPGHERRSFLMGIDLLKEAAFILSVTVVCLSLWIRSLLKEQDRQKEKLSDARDVLLQVAFKKCHCANTIIIEDLEEPEMVGKPLPKGSCEVCQARAVLAEDYPGAIDEEIRDLRLQGLPIPEDLFTVKQMRG